MEKEPDSMATVQMKADYAASEVYSTAGSEAPPAYIRHKSSSVQIAKIIALTVIASSFIIGSFILASVYMQARASCDQMQTLDSVLEKELMLEALQQEMQEFPRPEALLREITDNEIDKDEATTLKEKANNKKDTETETVDTKPAESDSDSETDSSFSDSDESGELNRVHIKLPLDLDLSELASALLENNQKSRMNCVVERRRAEEFVDAPAKTVQLPFGLNLTTEPKKQRVTGERMVIFCESGSEPSNTFRTEQTEQVRPVNMMPVQRYPVPYGAIPQGVPLTHMPQQMQPQPQMNPQPQHQMSHQQQFPHQFLIRQMTPSQQMMPQQIHQMPTQMHQMPPQMHQMPPQMHQMPPHPPMPQQMLQAPRPEQPEIRIQLHRIPLPIRGEASEPVQIRELRMPMQGRDTVDTPQPQIQVQRIPLAVALQRAGITPDDLRNIQQMAEDRIQQELRQLATEDSSSSQSSESHEDSSDEDDSEQDNRPQILQIGRSAFGRSLVTPVRIPVNIVQQVVQEENAQSNRPHSVQPRSVRSVDSVLKGEKRVKRCACDCNC